MAVNSSLEKAYLRLLEEHGYRPPPLEEWIEVHYRLTKESNDWARNEGHAAAPILDEQARELVLPGAFLDGTVPMNVLIAPLAREIEEAAREWSMSLPLPVYCGVFPTGEFNAVAMPVDGGALLLINEGLMYLIYQCMEVWGLRASIPSGSAKEEGLEPMISNEQAIAAIADAVYAYLFEGSSARAPQLPMIGGIRGFYLTMLAASIIKFVVAHEYGHAYAGHLCAEKAVRKILPGGEVNLIPKDWAEEYRADILAMRLLVPPSARKVNSEEECLEFAVQLVAPLAFFQLAQLIELTVGTFLRLSPGDILKGDHPPPGLRSKHIREWVRVIGGEAYMTMANEISSWLEGLQEDVAVLVVERRAL